MVANTLILKLATVLFGTFLSIKAGIFSVTNVTCNVDSDICKQNICKLEPIRKGIQMIDFACYFEEKLDNITFRLSLYKLGAGGRRIVDTTEDFCKVTANGGTATAMARLFPNAKKYGTILSACPLQGNITIMRYPVDFSFVPFVLTPGNYRLTGIFRSRESTKKIPIVHADLYFNVKNIFKTHYGMSFY